MGPPSSWIRNLWGSSLLFWRKLDFWGVDGAESPAGLLPDEERRSSARGTRFISSYQAMSPDIDQGTSQYAQL